jgi:Leucine-rich repeat (LRR) protein
MNIEEIEIDSLSFNGISLDSLIALKSLSLWGFTFKSFPMELSRLKELEELDLVLCSFTDFPQDLSAFNNLKRLDLSSNDISTIPKSVVFPKSLEVLILSNNALTDFPSASIPERLNKIDLTKNSFTFDKKVELLLDLLKNNQIDKIYVSTTSCEEKKKLNRITEDKNLKKKIKIFVSGKPICI